MLSSLIFLHRSRVSLLSCKPYFIGTRSQPLIRIILAKQYPVFCTRGKHSIGLIDAFGNQVINQYSYISFVAPQYKRLLTKNRKRSIYTRHQTLRSRFLIAGRTVDLPCQKQTLDYSRLKRRFQKSRIKEIIFYRVCRPEDSHVFKSSNSPQCSHLHLEGKRRRESLKIILVTSGTLRLKEKLMGIVVRKHPELILYAGTIARTATVNDTGKKRRLRKALAKSFVDFLVGMQDKAVHLRGTGLDA